MPDPKIEQPLLIPHEGRKPDWLEDLQPLFKSELATSFVYAGSAKWGPNLYFLPADHWAAPILQLRAETGENWTPWNAKLQGDGPPENCLYSKILCRDGTLTARRPLSTWDWPWRDHSPDCDIIGYIATPAQQQESGEGVKPVAWLFEREDGSKELMFDRASQSERAMRLISFGFTKMPLYAHPPAQPVGPAAGEVIDSDREAAKKLGDKLAHALQAEGFTAHFESSDTGAITQALKNHRLTHSPAPSATIERLEGDFEAPRELLRDVLEFLNTEILTPDMFNTLGQRITATLSTKDADHG